MRPPHKDANGAAHPAPWNDARVHFESVHRFHGSPASVARILADPGFYRDLDLPDLSLPEMVENRTEGNDAVVTLRYEFVGHLDPLARALLGGGRLTWVQEVRVDLRNGSGTLGFRADGDPPRLHGEASFLLVPDGDETVRRLEGDLVVAIPGVGGMAESRIVPGLLGRLDIEAQALDDRLRTEA